MRICIYGAGAIGGYLGALLSDLGVDVSLIARGPHLRAMQTKGLKLQLAEREIVTKLFCTDDPSECGPQDYVIVAMKAHATSAIVDDIQPLLGKDTAVVTAVNGIPWWYFYQAGTSWDNSCLQSVDPGGEQWQKIGPQRVIGCVVYPACEVIEPGVVQHIDGDRFTLGEPSNNKTPRVLQLSDILKDAGLKAPVRNIRDEIWIKLWGNLAFNPLSALTHATLDVLATDFGAGAIARTMMIEAQAIGRKLGVKFKIDVDKRIKGAAAVGAHKTSMLQDLERGRSLEIDALVTVVQELGGIVNVPTPTIDTVLALVQLKTKCYRVV